MRLRIAWVQARPGKDKLPAFRELTREYMERLGRYTPVESQELRNEAGLMKARREREFLVVLDARGRQLTSEELAEFLQAHQVRSTEQMLFAIGGADGFSAEARRAADFQLSLGPMTLPHELARVVLLEQLYRAFTILKGHPYHTGH